MNRTISMLATYIGMIFTPFYGDIFSSVAQMTVKTIIPGISG